MLGLAWGGSFYERLHPCRVSLSTVRKMPLGWTHDLINTRILQRKVQKDILREGNGSRLSELIEMEPTCR